MFLLISVAFNALILFAIQYFLPYSSLTDTGVIATGGWQLYLVGGIILGLLNGIVRPILKILGFPFMLVTFGLFIFVINGIILFLFQKVLAAFQMTNVSYDIHGAVNFAIAVAIFTVFNIVYSAFK